MIRAIVLAAGLASLALLTQRVDAQSYPSKPVRVIYPFQPGGVGETMFRGLLPTIEPRLGQQVLIESRSGAGGNIGAQLVANAPADGYTLLIGATNNFVINQFLYSGMTFGPLKAFTPIAIIAEVPLTFFVSAQIPARTLDEFVRYAKANPGMVNFASPGSGTTPHLSAELLGQLAGIQLTHVPYRGLPDAMKAVLANEVQLYLAGFGAGRGNVQAGRLGLIAIGGPERLQAMPDIPTVAEAGFPGLEAMNYFALVAPAGTDAAIVARWAAEVHHAISQPEAAKRLVDGGFIARTTSPADLRARMGREANLWEDLVRRRGIKAE
ncbi:MAG: Bug family tripartite tricarboxylate transporter substrate binding protein [Burkholderiales bacterium]